MLGVEGTHLGKLGKLICRSSSLLSQAPGRSSEAQVCNYPADYGCAVDDLGIHCPEGFGSTHFSRNLTGTGRVAKRPEYFLASGSGSSVEFMVRGHTGGTTYSR